MRPCGWLWREVESNLLDVELEHMGAITFPFGNVENGAQGTIEIC
jgi:hypothetical protein